MLEYNLKISFLKFGLQIYTITKLKKMGANFLNYATTPKMQNPTCRNKSIVTEE